LDDLLVVINYYAMESDYIIWKFVLIVQELLISLLRELWFCNINSVLL
jgi:hypothetical protein